jgi:hypothetical protein
LQELFRLFAVFFFFDVLEKVSPQHSGYASMIISTVACFALQIASSKRIVAKASPSLRC